MLKPPLQIRNIVKGFTGNTPLHEELFLHVLGHKEELENQLRANIVFELRRSLLDLSNHLIPVIGKYFHFRILRSQLIPEFHLH